MKGDYVWQGRRLYGQGGDAKNILSNPLRFEDMNMMRHTKTIGLVEIEPTVWKYLIDQDK